MTNALITELPSHEFRNSVVLVCVCILNGQSCEMKVVKWITHKTSSHAWNTLWNTLYFNSLWLSITLNAQILWFQGWSHIRPHVVIKHLLLGIFRGHMKRIRVKSQNLSKILGFQNNLKIEILHHLDKRKMDITHLILKILDSNSTCKPNFYIFDHFLILKYDIFQKNFKIEILHHLDKRKWT